MFSTQVRFGDESDRYPAKNLPEKIGASPHQEGRMITARLCTNVRFCLRKPGLDVQWEME